jgi:hypothetical protein
MKVGLEHRRVKESGCFLQLICMACCGDGGSGVILGRNAEGEVLRVVIVGGGGNHHGWVAADSGSGKFCGVAVGGTMQSAEF